MWQDVLIVHGQRMFLEGLRRLLADRHDMRVVGEASDGPGAVALAASLRPTIVLLESVLSGLDGIAVTRKITDAVPGVRVIVFAHGDSAQSVNQMINAGALGYLTPDASPAELNAAIDAVLSGQIYVSSKLDDVMAPPGLNDQRDPPSLTERQREVLRLMAEGRSTREIASALGVSVKTVETHRKHIMDRLGIHTVAELTKYAIRVGLTTL